MSAAFANMAVSDDPFDRWFRDHVREVHGINVEDGFPPPEQIMDYRAYSPQRRAEFCCSDRRWSTYRRACDPGRELARWPRGELTGMPAEGPFVVMRRSSGNSLLAALLASALRLDLAARRTRRTRRGVCRSPAPRAAHPPTLR